MYIRESDSLLILLLFYQVIVCFACLIRIQLPILREDSILLFITIRTRIRAESIKIDLRWTTIKTRIDICAGGASLRTVTVVAVSHRIGDSLRASGAIGHLVARAGFT